MAERERKLTAARKRQAKMRRSSEKHLTEPKEQSKLSAVGEMEVSHGAPGDAGNARQSCGGNAGTSGGSCYAAVHPSQ